MKFSFVVLALLVSMPFALGWNQAECEEVNWDHPDCDWGSPEPSKRSSADGGLRGTVSLWYITNGWVNGGFVCTESYEVKTFPGSGVFRETGVERTTCLTIPVFVSYSGLMGVWQ